jgi:filamentous hemagglutinin family protein
MISGSSCHLMTRASRLALISAAGLSLSGVAGALPVNPTVIASSPGQVTFSGNQTNALNVTSTSRRVVIDWSSFNIFSGEVVSFTLPDGTSIAVNRISGQCSVQCPGGGFNPTLIDGELLSNGNIWILDRSGVLFGSGARVDVGGLLATTADLLDPEAFVNAALADPVAFAGTPGDGGIGIFPGAVIRTTGGPAMFVATGGHEGRVFVGGEIYGEGTVEEQASSQILYGAAGAFSLRLGETAPNALTSSDLQLFDFIVDQPAFLPDPQQSNGPYSLIEIAAGSTSVAGQVMIHAEAAQSADDPDLRSQVRISGLVVARSADRTQGRPDAFSIFAPTSDIVLSRGGRVSQNSIELDPIVTLDSAGSLTVVGSSVTARKLVSLEGENGPIAAPDHATVAFGGSGGARITAARIDLDDAILNGADLVGSTIRLRNSFVDVMTGDVTFEEWLDAEQVNRPDGGAPDSPVAMRFGSLSGGSAAIRAGGELSVRDADLFGDLTLAAGGNVSALSLSADRIDLQSETAGVRVGSGTESTFIGGLLTARAGDLRVVAETDVRAGLVEAAGAVDILSRTGSVRLGDVTASRLFGRSRATFLAGDILVDEFANIVSSDANVLAGRIFAEGGDVLVTARSFASLADVAAGGAVDLLVTDGHLQAGELLAGSALRARGYRGLTLLRAQGASVALEAAQGALAVVAAAGQSPLQGPSVISTEGAVRIEARDAVTIDGADAAGSLLISSLQNAIASGDLLSGLSMELVGQTGVAAGRIGAGGPFSAFSEAGAIALGDVVLTDGGALIRGRDGVKTGGVEAPGDITVESLSGQVETDEIESDGDVRLAGHAGVLSGDVVAGGMVNGISAAGLVRAGSVTTGGGGLLTLSGRDGVDAGTLTSDGGVELRATEGSISAGVVMADAGAFVRGRDDISLASLTASNADVRSDTGKLSIGDAQSPGSVTSTLGDILLRAKGDISAGDVVSAGGIFAESTGGVLSLGDALAPLEISLIGRDGVSVRRFETAGAAQIRSLSGSVSAQSASSAGGDLSLEGQAGITTGDLQAGGDLTAYSADGAGAFGSLVAGDALNVQAKTGLAARAARGSSVRLSAFAGHVDIGLSGAAGFAPGAIEAVSGDLLIEGSQGVRGGAVSGAAAVSVIANAGRIDVGTVTAGADLSLLGREGVLAGDIRSRDDLFVEASTGAASLGTATSDAGSLTLLTRDALIAGALASAGSIEARSQSGAATLGDLTAGLSVDASGKTGLSVGVVDAGSDVRLNSVAGALSSGAVRARQGLADIRAAGPVRTGDVTVSSTAEIVSADDAVVGGMMDAGGRLLIGAKGDLTTAGVRAGEAELRSAGGDIRVGVSGTSGFLAGDLTTTGGALVLSAKGRIEAGRMSASGALRAEAGDGSLQTGEARAGGDLALSAGALLQAGLVTAGGNVELESRGGAIEMSDLTAGGDAILRADGAISGRDAGAAGRIEALSQRGDITLRDLRAARMSLNALGGDIEIGSARGATLRLSAQAGSGGAGAVRVAGALELDPASAGGIGASEVSLAIRAADGIRLDGAVTTERDILLDAGGEVRLGGPVIVRNALGDQLQSAEFQTAVFGGLDIRAGDLAILADVQVSGRAGVNIAAKGPIIRLGDNVGSGGLMLSAAEIARIRANSLDVRGGTGSAASATIAVGDLVLDRSRIAKLALATGATGRVTVSGAVSGVGAPDVTIGSSALAPGSIEITGSLGSASGRLGAVSLVSGGDILIGTQAFVDLVRAASDRTAVDISSLPPGFGGAEDGRLFLAAGPAAFDAPGVILSQNTGGRLGGGLSFTTGQGPVFGGASTPSRIEIFGSAAGPDGAAKGGRDTALLPFLLGADLAVSSAYKVNGCVIGSAAGCGGEDVLGSVNGAFSPGGDPPEGDGPAENEEEDQEDAAEPVSGDPAAIVEEAQAGPIRVEPSARGLLLPGDERLERDPGVGASNEDLWPGVGR